MAEDAVKRTAKNLISLMSVRAFDVIYMFLAMAILARYFGPSLFGDYAFITALVFIFLPLINFGVTPIMVRELSIHPERREEIFGAGLTFRLGLALVVVLGTVAVLPLTSLSPRLALALVICLVSELCLLGVRIAAEVFTTFERMELETYLGLANRVLSLILLLAIWYLDLGFLAVFLAFAALNGSALIAALLLVRGKFLKPRLVWCGQLLRFWIKEALPMAISFGIMETFLRVDILILRLFRDPSEIAYFDITYKIVYRIVMVASVMAIVLSPAMARLASSELDRFRALVEQGLKILLIIAIPSAITAHLLGPYLIVPFFGPKFRPAELAMATLAWLLFFSFFEPFLTGLLVSIKRAWLVPIVNGFALAINVALDLLLIPTHGYLGACYANLGAYFSWFIITLIVSYRAVGGFSILRVSSRILPVGLMVAVPLLFWHHAITGLPRGAPHTFFFTALAICLAMIAYGAMLYFAKAMTWNDVNNMRMYLGKPHP